MGYNTIKIGAEPPFIYILVKKIVVTLSPAVGKNSFIRLVLVHKKVVGHGHGILACNGGQSDDQSVADPSENPSLTTRFFLGALGWGMGYPGVSVCRRRRSSPNHTSIC